MSHSEQLIRAVLFDLDGTLVDNMRYHILAWIETGRSLGQELTAERIVRDFSGRKNEEILDALLGHPLDAAELDRLGEQKERRYRELYAPHLALLRGADAFLSQLSAHNIPCAIGTAAPRPNRAFVIDGLGLAQRVGAVVGAEEVARGKPAPDLFLEAARRIGHPPEACLVFEDAALGVQAGRAAGMQVCGITTTESGESLVTAGAFAVAPSFAELPAAVTALLGM